LSASTQIAGAEFYSMVERGAFDAIGPRKVESIRGEIRIVNSAGPLHDDYAAFITRWSFDNTTSADAKVRVQCSFVCDDDRAEPDILRLQPRRYGRTRPATADVILLIEVSDSSLNKDS
jgi:hypothetical protein